MDNDPITCAIKIGVFWYGMLAGAPVGIFLYLLICVLFGARE